MYKDAENLFLKSIVDHMKYNFEDFLEYEKGLSNTKSRNDNIYLELRAVIDRKIESFQNAIWVLKMGCEGHNQSFQTYMNQQTIPPNHEPHPYNLPILQMTVDWFSQYVKLFDKYNILLGEKILDFLIEVVQGPCTANQIFMSQTKILEYLEDVIFKIVPPDDAHNINNLDTLRIQDLDLSSFTKRIYIFILSLFEG